jgi:hypothetical protein
MRIHLTFSLCSYISVVTDGLEFVCVGFGTRRKTERTNGIMASALKPLNSFLTIRKPLAGPIRMLTEIAGKR